MINDHYVTRIQLKLGRVENGLNVKHNMTNVNVNISRIQSEMARY